MTAQLISKLLAGEIGSSLPVMVLSFPELYLLVYVHIFFLRQWGGAEGVILGPTQNPPAD